MYAAHAERENTNINTQCINTQCTQVMKSVRATTDVDSYAQHAQRLLLKHQQPLHSHVVMWRHASDVQGCLQPRPRRDVTPWEWCPRMFTATSRCDAMPVMSKDVHSHVVMWYHASDVQGCSQPRRDVIPCQWCPRMFTATSRRDTMPVMSKDVHSHVVMWYHASDVQGCSQPRRDLTPCQWCPRMFTATSWCDAMPVMSKDVHSHVVTWCPVSYTHLTLPTIYSV